MGANVYRKVIPTRTLWFIKTDQCTMPMGPHIEIFDTHLVKIIIETPAYSVYIILHSKSDRNTLFLYSSSSCKRGSKNFFIRYLVKVEIHAGDFNSSFVDPLYKPFYLACRPALKILIYRP